MLPEHLRFESPLRALCKEKPSHPHMMNKSNTFLSSSADSLESSDYGKVGEQLRLARELEFNAKKELEQERVKVQQAIERETRMMKEMQRRELAHEQQVAALMIRMRTGDHAGSTLPVCMCLYMYVCM